MATPMNTVGHSLLAHFSDFSFVGTLASLAPKTVYTVKVDAVDKNGIILAEAQTMQLTGKYEIALWVDLFAFVKKVIISMKDTRDVF